ncbi:MAG TPA: ABC transporter permease [Vicinamibacterales bacterium]|nr:ABC transporter permease [Vicinamibacterales bacterium]
MTDDTARRWYRRLLRLGPRRLRDRHAEAMCDAFLDVRRNAQARGLPAAVWVHAAADLVRASIHERRRHRVAPARKAFMIGSDVRLAVRTLRHQPFATALLIVMLTLGIAANVVVFSLVSDLFIKPFPFPDSTRLVYINEKAPRWNLDETGINYPDFAQWRKSNRAFAGMALVDVASFNLADERGAERVQGGAVTFDYFGVLGVTPLLGRTFTAAEDQPKAPDVAILSEAMWRDRFGAGADTIGRTIRLNGVAYQIVGVMPRAAEFPSRAAVWVPLKQDPASTDQSYSYNGVGRLKPGITFESAEQDLLLAHAPIFDTRDKDRAVSPFIRPLRTNFVRDFRVVAAALSAAVALLLIVACANVAAVMLARAIARRREMGIRLAIGANRGRLLRQLFVENAMLAAIGAAAGLVLGRWALHLLVESVADAQVLPPWATFAFDWRIAAFAVGIAAATAVLFGWAPALHAVRGNLRGAMNDASSGSTISPRGRRTLTTLVAAEFMVAAVLVVGGGLLVRAFANVRHTDPGYRADHALLFSIALPDASYSDDVKRLAFWETLTARLRATPGVEAAGVITCPPLSCHWGNFYRIEGRPPLKPGESDPVVLGRFADPGYFAAMGIRLKAGRFFDDRDGSASTNPALIVNETFARTFWPGEADVVGKRVAGKGPDNPWMTVVGVAYDVKHYGLERPMRPGLYFPIKLDPQRTSTMAVVIRTTREPDAFTPTARDIVRQLDPSLPLYRINTAERRLAASMQTRATYSWMLGVFAALALLLALGGAYGVTSYLVTQRTREIGIRMALGARGNHIMRAVAGGSFVAIAFGAALGLVAAIAAARLLGDLLYGVSPRDPMILSIAALTLFAAAVSANWIPARRAARMNPVTTLKT